MSRSLKITSKETVGEAGPFKFRIREAGDKRIICIRPLKESTSTPQVIARTHGYGRQWIALTPDDLKALKRAIPQIEKLLV